jgi:L-rhamnose mutarotase
LKRFCLALDLKDDPKLISEYEGYHKNIWPEIEKSIKDSGIQKMEIYRTGNRLTMVIDVDESFSFQKKAEADTMNPKVQEWEKLMWTYQQALPHAKPGEKWVLMDKIFQL